MKKNSIKKLALALAMLLILVTVFALSSCTMPEDYYVEQLPEGAVDWTLSGDIETLTNETEGVEYKLYKSFPFVFVPLGDVYVYCDTVAWNLNDNFSPKSHVYRPIEHMGVVWVEFEGARYYYASESGRAHLEALQNGEIGSYRLHEENGNYREKEVSKVLIGYANSDLKNGVNVEKINVGLLDNYYAYYIEAFDTSNQFSYNYAAVFTKDHSEFWYIKLSEIDHQLINEYGRINYDMLEEISVTRLNSSNTLSIRSCINGGVESQYTTYEYELYELMDDYEEPVEDMTGAIILSTVFFWIAVFAVGFVFPLPFIILGCALAFIKKLGRPKYWLAVAAFALLWMLAAALFSLIIILIILI